MKLIERTLYLDRLKRLQQTPDIKIVTGVRRCGKSKLLQAFAAYLAQSDPKANIIFIDFTKLSFESLKEYHALNAYVEQHTISTANNYLIIDEVQMCPSFEVTINSLHSANVYDIYLTGSNAFLLSADLATLFTGRHIEIPIFPFSFAEFCLFHSELADRQLAFDRYVVDGGMAGAYNYTELEDSEAYVREVFTTILTRDLVQKYKINYQQVLLHLAEYLMFNISNITSPNVIANRLTANETPTSHVTISRYIKMLCQAFVFYKADRFDICGRKYLESLNKYYLVDTSFRYAMLGRRNMDWGRAYENIVFVELLRRGYKAYVGKLYQKEIDFVAMKGSEKFYIQVSDNISAESTFEREVSPLLAIKDAYPKLLLARTRHPEYDHLGIRIIDIANWLCEG